MCNTGTVGETSSPLSPANKQPCLGRFGRPINYWDLSPAMGPVLRLAWGFLFSCWHALCVFSLLMKYFWCLDYVFAAAGLASQPNALAVVEPARTSDDAGNVLGVHEYKNVTAALPSAVGLQC